MKQLSYLSLFLISTFIFAQTALDKDFTETLDIDSLTRSGVDAVEVVAGYGEGTDNFRLATAWSFYSRVLGEGKWTLQGSLAANYSQFRGDTHTDVRLRDVGVTPVWRFIPNKYDHWFFQPFVEFGIGFHYLTQKQLPTKEFSTNFQFGDHIGFGVRYGPGQRHRLTYQFQHLSNGGIDAPNPGINFHLLSAGYRFSSRF